MNELKNGLNNKKLVSEKEIRLTPNIFMEIQEDVWRDYLRSIREASLMYEKELNNKILQEFDQQFKVTFVSDSMSEVTKRNKENINLLRKEKRLRFR